MHGLLHSGGRYAVSDQKSARECIEENRVLGEIASHCVEMTGGLFVKRPEDTEEYFEEKLRGCEDCGIPAEVISGEEARTMEPYLAKDVDRAISVPDGAVDPFRLVVANAASASEHGARIETHSTVTDLLVEDVSSHTFEAVEYLRVHEDLRGAVSAADVDGELAREFAYHAPCHARNQGVDRQAVELFRDLDGVGIEDVGESCSGISGTYGWKAEKYEKSMAIGEEMFEHMENAAGRTGMTECPTCAMQMAHGTGYEIRHPLELLEAALVE